MPSEPKERVNPSLCVCLSHAASSDESFLLGLMHRAQGATRLVDRTITSYADKRPLRCVIDAQLLGLQRVLVLRGCVEELIDPDVRNAAFLGCRADCPRIMARFSGFAP